MATGKRTEQEQSHESLSDKAAREAPDAPMTDHQAERLKVLSQEANVPFEDGLTRAEAEQRIEELQVRAGRDAPRP